MDDNIEYVSGHYQQFTEEPRMQELDIMQEKEDPVEMQPIIVRSKGRRKSGRRRRSSKKGGKKSNRKYKH